MMKGLIMTAAVVMGTSAAAGEVRLDQAQLDGLLTGNTVYLNVPAGTPGAQNGGVAPFYFGKDSRAVARLPEGRTLEGIWRMDGAGYRVDWSNGPKNSCTYVLKRGDDIAMMDAATDAERGFMTKIVPGNPEAL